MRERGALILFNTLHGVRWCPSIGIRFQTTGAVYRKRMSTTVLNYRRRSNFLTPSTTVPPPDSSLLPSAGTTSDQEWFITRLSCDISVMNHLNDSIFMLRMPGAPVRLRVSVQKLEMFGCVRRRNLGIEKATDIWERISEPCSNRQTLVFEAMPLQCVMKKLGDPYVMIS